MTNKIVRALSISTALLLVPITASFALDSWNWSGGDYVFAWVAFSVVSIALTFLLSGAGNLFYKLAASAAVLGAFLLVWINGAVGIIGDSDSNLMYGGVLAVLILGAAIARMRADMMSRVMVATAFAQFLVPVAALLMSEQDFSPGVLQVFVLNGFWVVLFLFSAIMFRNAATEGSSKARL